MLFLKKMFHPPRQHKVLRYKSIPGKKEKEKTTGIAFKLVKIIDDRIARPQKMII